VAEVIVTGPQPPDCRIVAITASRPSSRFFLQGTVFFDSVGERKPAKWAISSRWLLAENDVNDENVRRTIGVVSQATWGEPNAVALGNASTLLTRSGSSIVVEALPRWVRQVACEQHDVSTYVFIVHVVPSEQLTRADGPLAVCASRPNRRKRYLGGKILMIGLEAVIATMRGNRAVAVSDHDLATLFDCPQMLGEATL